MRYFLDCEFYEKGYARIDLISIGIVDEAGGGLGIVAADGWDEDEVRRDSPWLTANVLPHLEGCPRMPRAQIAEALREFVQVDPKPEFWGYYCDYDWVLLCQLFGRMVDLPKGWPMYCRDLKQMSSDLGSPPHPKQSGDLHSALADARWNRDLYRYLVDCRNAPRQ